MIKLSKSEREALEQAAQHPAGRVTVHAWSQHVGKPFARRRKSGGLRKHEAIQSLVNRGLLDRYSVHHHRGYAPGGEWRGASPIYSAEATAFITEAGRALIAEQTRPEASERTRPSDAERARAAL